MENIRTDLGLPDKPVFQQSPIGENQNDARQISGVPGSATKKHSQISEYSKPWKPEGVVFSHGTELRGKYKGYVYYARVANGVLKLNGREFLSPCAAATTITRKPVDGWLFWECKLPDRSNWMSICEFKKA